jgi:hypothetical protein
VAKDIISAINGKENKIKFDYKIKGMMTEIGKNWCYYHIRDQSPWLSSVVALAYMLLGQSCDQEEVKGSE